MSVMEETVGAKIAGVLSTQDGVISRRQALACGCTDNDIRRLVRRRDWALVYPGVCVDHTGPLTWEQRAWAAVLDASPAALGFTSVLPHPGSTIHIVVAEGRRVARRPGVVLHRRANLDAAVVWTRQPPRLRTEEAALDVAAAARNETDAIALLADIVNARVTTAQRLLDALARRRRIRRRKLLEEVLIDIRDGTCSVLEHRFLTRVERPHGLPRPIRQNPTTVGRRGFRDLDYPGLGVVVELDGWRFHDTAADRDADLERDLDAAIGANRLTLRLGSGQVIGRACSTAAKLAQAFTDGGWSGRLQRCPDCA